MEVRRSAPDDFHLWLLTLWQHVAINSGRCVVCVQEDRLQQGPGSCIGIQAEMFGMSMEPRYSDSGVQRGPEARQNHGLGVERVLLPRGVCVPGKRADGRMVQEGP